VVTGNKLQTSTLNYKLIKKVRDDRFDEEFIHQYHLLINIGTRDFQLAVYDPIENIDNMFEYFFLPNINTHEKLLLMMDH
jgi:hypothetical protein